MARPTGVTSTVFTEVQPTLENYWRSVILFGRNVASYKFALGKSLLEFADREDDFIRLDDLAGPFSRNVCEHLQAADKQATSKSSRFLTACRDFNAGNIEISQLIDTTTKLGFVNVIDAFHVVHDGSIPVRFYVDERTTGKGIRLTDEFRQLSSHYQFQNLPFEIESRWQLVQTAWAENLPNSVMTVAYDPDNEFLVTNDRLLRRKSVTGCGPALIGYQKGKCFYCFRDIRADRAHESAGEVDHFFAHSLKQHGFGTAIDGVWNLVLACRQCNRGSETGKMAKIPVLRLLERLHQRNSFFIDSHHPLRETLIQQTGRTEPKRRRFLQDIYTRAKNVLLIDWAPTDEREAAF